MRAEALGLCKPKQDGVRILGWRQPKIRSETAEGDSPPEASGAPFFCGVRPKLFLDVPHVFSLPLTLSLDNLDVGHWLSGNVSVWGQRGIWVDEGTKVLVRVKLKSCPLGRDSWGSPG
jgi:hypothetical protein